MKNKIVVVLSGVVFSMLLSACMHDEESNVSVSVLDGVWFGYEENFNTTAVNRVRFVINRGSITQVLREDKGLVEMVDLNIVGVVNVTTNNVFSYEFSNNLSTLGTFFTDDNHNYITFVDDKFNFGVLQKGSAADADLLIDPATTTLVFDANDISGSWVGFGANIRNGSMTVASEYDSSLTVELDTLNFVGAEAANSVSTGQYTGSFFQSDGDRGVYKDNNWTNPVDVNTFGDLTMILSPDKSYAAGRICLPVVGVANIESCSFMSLL